MNETYTIGVMPPRPSKIKKTAIAVSAIVITTVVVLIFFWFAMVACLLALFYAGPNGFMACLGLLIAICLAVVFKL